MANLREISAEEWESTEYKNYIPIDIRDEAEFQLGLRPIYCIVNTGPSPGSSEKGF